MTCVICGRKADDQYCPLHQRAYMNLIKGFEAWQHALGINWRDYLQKIAVNQYTGKWAVEVCTDLLTREERL